MPALLLTAKIFTILYIAPMVITILCIAPMIITILCIAPTIIAILCIAPMIITILCVTPGDALLLTAKIFTILSLTQRSRERVCVLGQLAYTSVQAVEQGDLAP